VLHISTNMAFALAVVIGYLAGSIPFGLLLTKIAGVGDIRAIGSGSIGATNVLRTGRKGLAAATVALDAGKGAVVVLLAMSQTLELAAVAGLAAVVGHNFPVWLKFKGGKGIATSGGVLFAISWPVGTACTLTWLVVVVLTRYSSVGALAACATLPLWAWLLSNEVVIWLAVVLAVLGIARHHANIRRLLNGEESRIGRTKSAE
jgi:acyl phosphate:glycerol-3-phosphate acyltransferase